MSQIAHEHWESEVIRRGAREKDRKISAKTLKSPRAPADTDPVSILPCSIDRLATLSRGPVLFNGRIPAMAAHPFRG
jgi:hypothetical protein